MNFLVEGAISVKSVDSSHYRLTICVASVQVSEDSELPARWGKEKEQAGAAADKILTWPLQYDVVNPCAWIGYLISSGLEVEKNDVGPKRFFGSWSPKEWVSGFRPPDRRRYVTVDEHLPAPVPPPAWVDPP